MNKPQAERKFTLIQWRAQLKQTVVLQFWITMKNRTQKKRECLTLFSNKKRKKYKCYVMFK